MSEHREQRVWIAQLLCGPQRHAIMAASGVAEDEHAALEAVGKPLREQIEQLLADGTLNPWCGICGAVKEGWRYEVGRTRWRTIEEALPALQDAQAANLLANRLMGGHPGPGKVN